MLEWNRINPRALPSTYRFIEDKIAQTTSKQLVRINILFRTLLSLSPLLSSTPVFCFLWELCLCFVKYSLHWDKLRKNADIFNTKIFATENKKRNCYIVTHRNEPFFFNLQWTNCKLINRKRHLFERQLWCATPLSNAISALDMRHNSRPWIKQTKPDRHKMTVFLFGSFLSSPISEVRKWTDWWMVCGYIPQAVLHYASCNLISVLYSTGCLLFRFTHYTVIQWYYGE